MMPTTPERDLRGLSAPLLGEKVGPRRLALMSLIAAGAVIVEFAG